MKLTVEELDLFKDLELFQFIKEKHQDQLNGSVEYDNYVFDEMQDDVSVYLRITGCLKEQGFHYSRKVKLISEEPNSNVI